MFERRKLENNDTQCHSLWSEQHDYVYIVENGDELSEMIVISQETMIRKKLSQGCVEILDAFHIY